MSEQSSSIVRQFRPKGMSQNDLLFKLESLGFGAAGSRIIQRVDQARALRQSVVIAASDIIAQDIGKVRLDLVVESREAVRVLEPDEHPFARRLRLRPHRHQTWIRFWLQTIPCYLINQEVLVYKRRRSRSDVDPDLVPLLANEWTQTTNGGRFFYDVSPNTEGRVALLGGTLGRISEDDVIHFVARSANGYEGLSTLSVGSDVLGLNAMIIDFQAALVKSGIRPAGAITVPELMNDEAFARLKAQVTGALNDAAEKGEPLLLEQGAEFKSISLDADQTDLVNARNQINREVARLFRMPPHKLGMTEDLNRSNLEAMEKAYVDDTLVPICEVIEQEMSAAMLSEDERLRGLTFKFDRTMLYARDPQARADRIESQFKAGLLWSNEARAMLSRPPLSEDQDFRSLPVNTAMLKRDGTVQIFTSKPDGSGNQTDAAPATEAKSANVPPINVTLKAPDASTQAPVIVNLPKPGTKTITMRRGENGELIANVEET